MGIAGPKQVVLPRLGKIRTKEATHKLATLMGAGNAQILSATIALEAGQTLFQSADLGAGFTPGKSRATRLRLDLEPCASLLKALRSWPYFEVHPTPSLGF
jgi:hypothetical protein